jgi:signal transduction histidine kinase
VQSERQKHEQQGAGMGLPIVRQTMLLHGGQASLQSEVDAGTVVTLRLPLYQDEV